MTFSARLAVREVTQEQVEEGRTETVVRATAEPGDNAITSNTEGDVRSMELTVRLGDEQTALKQGDVISVSGHFDGQVAAQNA
jgi:hypothetical protein